MESSRDRRRIFFSGRVQGVGFRYTCHTLAQGFRVGGWVRNLVDGRVELLAEADADEIDRFLAAIRWEMDHFIDEIVIETEPSSVEQLSDFSIRH